MMKRFRILEICKRTLTTKTTPHQQELMRRGLPKRTPLKDVDNIVVVASGKGGVGKSTIAVNLSATLALMGKRVGLLDGDVFGPSVPLMMNIHEEPLIDDNNLIIPPMNYGVKCLSMGLLRQKGDALVWRGPMVMSAIQKLLKGAIWGPLDILIIDTPPGTGDVHLSISQNVPISGVLLVSTPQTAALEVTERGAQMYKTLDVPILGLAENMGHATCSNCQTRIDLFKNTTEKFITSMKTKLLAAIPLDGDITECCDSGVPIVLRNRNSQYTNTFRNLAENILVTLEKQNENEQNE